MTDHQNLSTSLADVPIGATVLVTAHHTSASLSRRLSELGVRPGTTVTLHQRTAGGGRVVSSGSARYAIDLSTLRAVEVKR